MEEGDYWESFEISENESDNEIQSEYTDTDSSDDSDIIVQKKRKVYVIKSDTHDIGSYSEEIDEDDDDWQDITESDEVPVGKIYCDTCPNKPRVYMGDCFHKYHTKCSNAIISQSCRTFE
ncbi:uncharacterized protein LOC119637623 isoform X1 [Glossina fuscipes]|uniref:Uncharacterized protein LOC119637623 isoform X1 n=1 Tax=Glossina fuscipes TaxID=7396 RepID=A0A9C6DST3_9MUSC|nr:uncharacterized protein LOC119637623 isoform X1 [Glossina fuscipes]